MTEREIVEELRAELNSLWKSRWKAYRNRPSAASTMKSYGNMKRG